MPDVDCRYPHLPAQPPVDVERLTDSLILAGLLTPKIGYKQTAIRIAAEYARLTTAEGES
jgi:hypothetical protein